MRWIAACAIVGFLIGASVDRGLAADLDEHERHEQIEVVEAPPFRSVEEVVRFHASSRGVRPEPILALLWCESSLRADAVGDHGTSLGIAQLSTLPTGLIHHYRFAGYNDPFDAEEAVRYVVAVAAGDYLPSGPEPAPVHPFGRVDLSRWSCWWVLG